MKKLNLIRCNLGNEGLNELLKGTNLLQNLIKLQLSSNDIGDNGLEQIAKCDSLQKLTYLDLGFN